MRRYIGEKKRYIQNSSNHRHLLIVPGETSGCREDGRSKIYTIRSPRLDATSQYRLLLNTEAVRDILRAERPDVIECGDPYHLAWVCLEEADPLGIPVAGFYHSHFPDAYLRTVGRYFGHSIHDFVQEVARRYISRLYRSFDATLVPSDKLRDLLITWGVIKSVSVRLGVDTSIFRPAPRNPSVRKSLGIEPDQILLLGVGRLGREKGVPTILAAYREIERRAPGRFRLLLIGDGSLRPMVLRAQAELPGLSWISYCTDPYELADYYRAADLFVHPGVHETFGLVTVEAQACGTPALGIDGTGMERLAFAGGEYWAKANDPAALADGILAICEQPLRQMGAEAAKHVLAEYDWCHVFDGLFDIYRAMRQAH